MPNRLQWWRDRARDPRFMLVLAALTLITLATAFMHIVVKVISSSGAASGLPLVY